MDIKTYLGITPGRADGINIYILCDGQKWNEAVVIPFFESLYDAWAFVVSNGLPDPMYAAGRSINRLKVMDSPGYTAAFSDSSGAIAKNDGDFEACDTATFSESGQNGPPEQLTLFD